MRYFSRILKDYFCYTFFGDYFMYLSTAVRKRIYELCDERNITINRLCTISGITQSTLANMNSRQNANLNILTIMRICRGLNITLQDFFNSSIFNIDSLEDD